MVPLAVVGTVMVAATTAYFFKNQLDGMGGRGGKITKQRRVREDYGSVEEWLMSKEQRAKGTFGLEGKTVQTKSSARSDRWEVDEPPKMNSIGASHFNGILGERWSDLLMPDLVVLPDPVKINASRDRVRMYLPYLSAGRWETREINDRSICLVAVR